MASDTDSVDLTGMHLTYSAMGPDDNVKGESVDLHGRCFRFIADQSVELHTVVWLSLTGCGKRPSSSEAFRLVGRVIESTPHSINKHVVVVKLDPWFDEARRELCDACKVGPSR